MIDRYSIKEISEIWSDESKYNTWLKVELLVCEGWHKLGVISETDLKNIQSKVNLNLNRMWELENETKHDVVAFTRMLSEQLGVEKKWIHLGLTSTDIVDTSQNYLIKLSNQHVEDYLQRLADILKEKSLKYKSQIIMGRTHGIYAEPTSLGLKFLLWYEECNRNIERFLAARKQVEVAKISGSVGNYAHIDPQVESYVANALELNIDSLSTQVTSRDRHCQLFSSFAMIASLLEKIAVELRLFQQSEINELAEGFSANQKGSSSMPHKKNPISSENITGLARLIKSNFNVMLENNILWHERDISHSSNERIIIPETFHLVVYTLKRMCDVLTNLVVNEHEINKHLNEAKNIYFSQPLLTYILKQSMHSREEVYDFIQECASESQSNDLDFKDVLIDKGIYKYISETEFVRIFDKNIFFANINFIYNRVLKSK